MKSFATSILMSVIGIASPAAPCLFVRHVCAGRVPAPSSGAGVPCARLGGYCCSRCLNPAAL